MTETLTLKHHVAGRSISAPAAFEQPNPADPADFLVTGPGGDKALADEAATAARAAVGPLYNLGVEKRADILSAIGRKLMENAAEIAVLIARETGKTLGDAKGETMRAARLFDFFAGETIRNIGEVYASTRKGAGVEVTYDPLGVVAAITPWNFPIAIPAWKIAPALAFGNAVVWKPSEYSSATANVLMEIIAAAGLPDGAVNMILGAGKAGAAVCEADGIDAISFTGSVATGTKVRLGAAARGQRMQLEMGGVNGLIIMADADFDAAVECAVNGAFYAAGQRCTATSRIIVENAIADRFAAALRSRLQALKVGNPLDAATVVGPLISLKQKAAISAQVATVEKSGLVPVFGGTAVEMPHAFFAPTLFDHVPTDNYLNTEEIFAPVAGMFRVGDFEEAMQLLNMPSYTLSAGICTTSLSHAAHFKRKAKAGVTMVNLPTAGIDYHAPFGGVGGSSYGPREQGRAARQFYTVLRTCYQSPV